MGSPDEEGLKGNKKGRPVWAFVKNASLAITIFLFFFTIVLVLDAYKFVSVRVSRCENEKEERGGGAGGMICMSVWIKIYHSNN
mmetsp:Transcript_28341/g.53498  ORF Transcript_28341/g.53498 Transcript_28341/m.53498 type:complete len:84 (-) Transcript_28341:801-1052(-)